MNMDVKIDFNKVVCLHHAQEQIDKATKGTAMRFRALADPYVPFLTGTTAKSAGFSDFDKGEITYDTPYAHYIYYAPDTFHLTKDKHPNAITHWGEFVGKRYKRELLDTFQKILDRSAL